MDVYVLTLHLNVCMRECMYAYKFLHTDIHVHVHVCECMRVDIPVHTRSFHDARCSQLIDDICAAYDPRLLVPVGVDAPYEMLLLLVWRLKGVQEA